MSVVSALEELNREITDLSDAVRAKSGKTGKMGFIAMTEAVKGISTGAAVQRANGTFDTNSAGKATVNCGFQPDLVTIYLTTYNGIEEGLSIPFAEQQDKSKPYCALGYAANCIYEVTANKTATGFTVEVYDLGWGSAHTSAANRTGFKFTAVKYE